MMRERGSDREIKKENENKTIGILLSTDKNETIVKYTLPEDNKTIFSSEFRLFSCYCHKHPDTSLLYCVADLSCICEGLLITIKPQISF